MTASENKALGKRKIYFTESVFKDGKTTEQKRQCPWKPGKSKN